MLRPNIVGLILAQANGDSGPLESVSSSCGSCPSTPTTTKPASGSFVLLSTPPAQTQTPPSPHFPFSPEMIFYAKLQQQQPMLMVDGWRGKVGGKLRRFKWILYKLSCKYMRIQFQSLDGGDFYVQNVAETY